MTLVPHDLRADAMRHLDRALVPPADEGADFTTQYPAACLALREGALPCDPAPSLGRITRHESP